jgi:hypothetical protein
MLERVESDGKYWAHSDPDCAPGTTGGLWQPLAEHLQNVSELARTLAQGAAPEDKPVGPPQNCTPTGTTPLIKVVTP